ncbi:MAG: hypothetical protein ABI883_00345, partial [Chthoniobacterales bacterium]
EKFFHRERGWVRAREEAGGNSFTGPAVTKQSRRAASKALRIQCAEQQEFSTAVVLGISFFFC